MQYTTPTPMAASVMITNLRNARSRSSAVQVMLKVDAIDLLRDLLDKVRSGYFRLRGTAEADLLLVWRTRHWAFDENRVFTLEVTTDRGWQWCREHLPSQSVVIVPS